MRIMHYVALTMRQRDEKMWFPDKNSRGEEVWDEESIVVGRGRGHGVGSRRAGLRPGERRRWQRPVRGLRPDPGRRDGSVQRGERAGPRRRGAGARRGPEPG